MATILAHITIKPGKEARFEEIASALYKGTHAHEKSVTRYEYWRGAEKGQYYALLSFPDYHGFLAHQSSEHHETEGAKLGEVMDGIRLEWIDPIQGASPLASTNMQGMPPNASETVQRYFNTMPAQVAEWWKALR